MMFKLYSAQVIRLLRNFPVVGYSDIPTNGFSRPSLPQEKKEKLTIAKLRLCNGIKQLRWLIEEVFPFG